MRLQFIRLIFITVCILTITGVSTASTDSDNEFVPFEVGKAGATVSYEFSVSWMSKKYPRNLYMSIGPKGRSWNDKEGNSLVEKYEILMESLTGLTVINYKGDIPPKPHKGIRLHVVWAEKKSGKILKQNDVYVHKSSSGDFGIDGLLLPSGAYVVTVQALDDDPRFDGTFKTSIAVGYRWK